MRSNPKLRVRQLLDFLQKASQRAASYPILVNELDLREGASKAKNTGDFACCGLLLLIEKSPSTEKH
jgi:hypothetical protein